MSLKEYYISKPASLIQVNGPDASDYLQSQCTQDISKLSPGTLAYSLFLNRKGKVQADAFILKLGEEDFRLFSYFTQEDPFLSKLSENIIADEVDMEPKATDYRCITILSEELEKLPTWPNISVSEQGVVLPGRRSTSANFDILFPLAAKAYWTELLKNEGFTQGKEAEKTLELERIKSAIPAIPQDIGPNELPQEGGLEGVALSFKKGCYLGQEVMARLQSIGQVQKGLYQIEVHSEDFKNEELPISLESKSKSVGEIRSLNPNGAGLALLKKRFLESTQPDRLALDLEKEIKLINKIQHK